MRLRCRPEARRARRRPSAGCGSGGRTAAKHHRQDRTAGRGARPPTISSAVKPRLSRYSISAARSCALAMPAASSASKSTTHRSLPVALPRLGLNPVSEIQHGPLEERHRQLGASFAEFSGWLMPVAYAGTVGEHTATRTAVGLFDVSHLGKASVRGSGAAEYVNSDADQRPRPDRPRQGAIHVVLHRIRRCHRRFDRLLRVR